MYFIITTVYSVIIFSMKNNEADIQSIHREVATGTLIVLHIYN